MEAAGSVAEVGAAERAPVDIDAATMPMRIQPPMNGSIGKKPSESGSPPRAEPSKSKT